MRDTEKVMILCDTEAEYAQLFTEFLRKKKNLPWVVRTYTSPGQLLEKEQEPVSLMVVAESVYSEKLGDLCPARMVILNESGVMKWENHIYIDKYQEAEEVYRQLLAIYAEVADIQLPRLKRNCKTVFVGNFTPVHRSMQTSFALTLGQMLAEKHTTLYLNFEQYTGLEELVPKVQIQDLADLLYFLNSDKAKFRLRMQTMMRHLGNLDYIPPMKSGQNLLYITAGEWLELLSRIEETGEYEYVILDLSEGMQGLFDLLRLCKKIFTMVGDDRIARGKLEQYEHLLALYDYGDVAERTRKVNLSHIHKLPPEIDQYTKGDLAMVVRDLIKEIENGGDTDGVYGAQEGAEGYGAGKDGLRKGLF